MSTLGVGFDLHLHLGRAESPCVLAFLSEILKNAYLAGLVGTLETA